MKLRRDAGLRPFRIPALLTGAVAVSMGIFALVPLLLRQTSYEPRFASLSHALLIPVRPEPPPDPLHPEPELEPPPEPPAPPEPKMEVQMPEIPEILPPEPELPDPEMDKALDTPLLDPPTLSPPPLQRPPLHKVALSALPIQSSPLNLKVNLRVGKAATPGTLVQQAAVEKPTLSRTRFGLDQVDQKPISLAALKPEYPFRAKRMGIEGHVTVQFLVDREGKTRDITIVAAEPKGVFDQAVRNTVPRWRFKPGKKAGRPVDTWVEMTIRFELERDG